MVRLNGERKSQIVVPHALKAFILRHYHGLPLTGHMGIKRVYKALTQCYYWKDMKTDVTRWIRSCLACARRKTTKPHDKGVPLTMQGKYPGHTWAIDLVGKLIKTKRGNKYILTMIDTFSRWFLCVPIANKRPSTIAHAIYRHLLCVHGVPKKIVSDRGTEFVNKGLESMCKTWNIVRLTTAPRNSRGNSHVERTHRWLNEVMTNLRIHFGPEWDDYCDAMAFAYRVSVHDSTGYSPFELTYGRKPRLPDNLMYNMDIDIDQEFKTERDYAMFASEQMHKAYEHVRKQQYQIAEQNRQRNFEKAEPVKYMAGQTVLVWLPDQAQYCQNSDHSNAVKAPSKWGYRWTGPFSIIRQTGQNTYDVREESTGRLGLRYHVNNLTPFTPWSDTVMSTSPDLDKALPWRTHGNPARNDLIAIAMKGEDTFAIAKLLENDDGKTPLKFQWMSNMKDKYDKHSTFKLGWIRPDGKTIWATRPQRNTKPYTGLPETKVYGEWILLHGFALNADDTLPKPVRAAIVKNREAWQIWLQGQ
jgi:hypothetical protein